MKNKNKQKREKKKRRLKHPDLGRAKGVVRSPYTRNHKKEPDKCPTCDTKYKNIQILYGEMVKHICECNTHLVDEAIERLRIRQAIKAKKNHPCTVKTIELTM